MALPQDRYVKITSTNAGDADISDRDLCGLLFTKGTDTGAWTPTDKTFTKDTLVITHSIDQVAKYWSEDSKEYKSAVRYFGYVSPSSTSAATLTFAKWGDADETPAGALKRLNDDTNNFGSFAFAENDITLAQVKAVADANAAYNYRYLYSVAAGPTDKSSMVEGTDPLSSVSAKQVAAYLGEMRGTSVTVGYVDSSVAEFDATAKYAKGAVVLNNDKYYKCTTAITSAHAWNESEWKEIPDSFTNPIASAAMPMAIFAAVDYSGLNTATYFMFKQFDGETATVSDTTTADDLDGVNCNYYGLVQINGQRKSFYQRGRNLDGENTAVYCNEVWLKARISTDIMNLFLGVERIPANEDGELMLYGVIAAAANQGIQNGTIELGKTLTNTQKTKIYQLTGDSEAWFTIQQSGYTISVEIKQDGSEYKAYYKLIYPKGDSICYVEGSDILI